jgi:hypothetical protein
MDRERQIAKDMAFRAEQAVLKEAARLKKAKDDEARALATALESQTWQATGLAREAREYSDRCAKLAKLIASPEATRTANQAERAADDAGRALLRCSQAETLETARDYLKTARESYQLAKDLFSSLEHFESRKDEAAAAELALIGTLKKTAHDASLLAKRYSDEAKQDITGFQSERLLVEEQRKCSEFAEEARVAAFNCKEAKTLAQVRRESDKAVSSTEAARVALEATKELVRLEKAKPIYRKWRCVNPYTTNGEERVSAKRILASCSQDGPSHPNFPGEYENLQSCTETCYKGIKSKKRGTKKHGMKKRGTIKRGMKKRGMKKRVMKNKV